MEKTYYIKAKREFFLFLPLCLCIILSGYTAHVAYYEIIKLLLTLLCVYFLPGYLLLRITDIVINPIIEVFLALFLGYSSNIFLYFFALIFNIQEDIKIITVVYVLLLFTIYGLKAKHTVITQYGKIQNEEFKLSQEPLWIISIFLCTYIIAYFTYQSNNLSAEVTGYLNQHQDNTFWFRNTAAALKTYPVPKLSTYGVSLYYHLFSNFQLAFLHLITNIEIFDLCFSFSFIWNLFLLVGGVYWFFNEVLSIRFHIHLGIIIVLFTTGTLTSMTGVFFLNHLYIASFGFAEGFSASFYAISCVFHLLNKQDFSKKKWAVSLLLFAVALGGKAPCGCIVLVGAIATSLWLFLKKKWKPAFYISFFYSLVFTIEYLVLFYAPYNAYTANHTARKGFSIIKTLTERNTYYINYHSFLSGFLHNSWISAFILIGIFLFITNFIVNYYVFVSIYLKIRNLIKEKSVFFLKDKFEFIIWAMFIASYFCFIIFWQDGYSQVYFAFVAFPYGILISFYYLEKYKLKTSIYSSIHSIGLVLTGMGIALSIQCIFPYAIKGSKNLLGIIYETPSIGSSITRDEEEAMSWIKNNTDNDALFITNKLFCGYMGTHSFITSAYTERQMYLEGYAYESLNSEELEKRLNMVASYFQGDENSNTLLKNQGVDYAILFKNVEGYNSPASTNTIFENSSVCVLKINE